MLTLELCVIYFQYLILTYKIFQNFFCVSLIYIKIYWFIKTDTKIDVFNHKFLKLFLKLSLKNYAKL